MNHVRIRLRLALALVVCGLAASTASTASAQQAPSMTQSLLLQPGWNAIHFEVEPDSLDPADVFASVIASERLLSVWRFARTISSAQFIVRPGDDLSENPEWLPFFPANTPESVLTNLDEIQGNRPYLVHVTEGAAVPLDVVGRPSVASLRWEPSAFTLTGFPVDPVAPATFGQFFEASPAHADGLIYRLLPSGTWTPVAPGDPIASGEAYWVFTESGSQHQGPFEVDVPDLGGVDFSRSFSERAIRVTRRSGPGTVSLSLVPSSAPVPLAYRTIAELTPVGGGDAGCALTWLPFDGAVSLPLPPCGEVASPPPEIPIGGRAVLNVGAIRRDFGSDEVASLLEISNGAGVRWRVPVNAARRVPGATP